MGRNIYKSFIKRYIDILVSLICIIISLPLLILLLPLISHANSGPVFFTQIRPGKHGKLFRLLKLKTMNDERDQFGKLLADNKRITTVGKIIRSLSLDELPQFINVLKGEMSIVGPRPLLSEYLALYNEKQSRRHEVRPGITGWAQINGRNNTDWEKRLQYDIWYVDNVSFILDTKIIYSTIFKILSREGINSSDAITMRRFEGTPAKKT